MQPYTEPIVTEDGSGANRQAGKPVDRKSSFGRRSHPGRTDTAGVFLALLIGYACLIHLQEMPPCAVLPKNVPLIEDRQTVQDHLVAEVIHGQLHTTPRPAPRHPVAASATGGELFSPYHRGGKSPDGWWILDEPELHLGSHVLTPDLAG